MAGDEKQVSSIQSLSLIKIWQVDNNTFAIEWSDGFTAEYRLSAIQRNCPCAGCCVGDDKSRTPADVDENVQALSIKNAGNYALAIRFTSGCSAGIYSYELMRSLAKGKL